MTIAVLELNDAEVRVFQSGDVVARSPGIAVLKEDRVVLGQAAMESAHIDPRNTFSRFWSNLNQDSFKRRTKRARHNADLAHAHLLSLHELADQVDEVVFAVPGSFTTEQLSLLLGLAQASPFTPVGLVDSAVAAGAAATGAGSYNHLDIHLHHALVTSLEVSGSVQRVAVEVVDDTGLLAIQDKCVNHIADLFIRQSRFDPLHHAATEQALCNSLAQCLHELRDRADALVEIGFENTRYQARVNRERLVETLRPLYSRIGAATDPDRVSLVHKRLAGLPMFAEHLATAGNQAEVLDEGAVYAGCMSYMSERGSAGEEIYFVTQLRAAPEPAPSAVATADPDLKPEVAPAPAPSAVAAAGPELKPEPAPSAVATVDPQRDSEAAPTHILVDAEAHPLRQVPLYLSAQGAVSGSGGQEFPCSLSLNGAAATLVPSGADAAVYVNGHAVSDNADLKPGDIISFTGSDRAFTLIKVL